MTHLDYSHPNESWDLDTSFRWHVCLIFLYAFLFFALTPPARAETKEEAAELQKVLDEAAEKRELEDTTTKYAPDYCDFEITFPDKPYSSKRCPEGTGKCYDLTNYTMVYGNLATTMEISVTCVPSTPANYRRYNDRALRAVLNGMVGRAGIDQFTIDTRDGEFTRQGTMTGAGTEGKKPKKYQAQLWVGQNSLMTVEAKLVGRNNPEAAKTYTDILKSIQVK